MGVTQRQARYRFEDVRDQVDDYPAAERWTAVSADALKWVTHREPRDLVEECRDRGIGLLRVSATHSVTVVERAREGKHDPDGQKGALAYYVCGPRLLAELAAKIEQHDARNEVSLSDMPAPAEGVDNRSG